MSLKRRLVLLVGMLVLALVGSLLALRYLEAGQLGQIRAESRRARRALVDRWVGLAGDSLRRFVDDGSRWNELRRFVDHPDPRWPDTDLKPRLAALGVGAAWILDRDGRVVGAVRRLTEPALDRPPVPVSAWPALVAATPHPHFFVSTANGLLEFRGAPIPPPGSEVVATRPSGWFLVAKPWDESQLHLLAELTESQVRLASPATDPPMRAAGDAIIRLERPLTDWQGHTVARLQFVFSDPDVAQVIETNRSEILAVAAFGFLLIGALAIGLHRWVLRPLARIGDSLARADTTPLRALLQEGDRTELGRVARLIESDLARERQLVREIEERTAAEAALLRSEVALRRTLEDRARLGRDLHDSVIQSLYATGMGLVGIRALLPTHPDEADRRIDQARSALNETITDLRNFIGGLEPEALKEQSFTQAVARLVDVMQAMRPVHAKLAIDEDVAKALTLPQRAHALQIAREAVSNALRHGGATEVSLSLQRQGSRAAFVIEDDGRGFDPAIGLGKGHGLTNLTERALELGAELKVSSAIGRGARVTLVLPLTITT